MPPMKNVDTKSLLIGITAGILIVFTILGISGYGKTAKSELQSVTLVGRTEIFRNLPKQGRYVVGMQWWEKSKLTPTVLDTISGDLYIWRNAAVDGTNWVKTLTIK